MVRTTSNTSIGATKDKAVSRPQTRPVHRATRPESRRFQEFLVAAGYSHAGPLAAELGVTRQAIWCVVYGQRSGEKRLKRLIAEKLGVDYETLWGERPKGENHENP